MANVNADQHLLFGLLALQNDFISRERLISAVGVWLQDKTKPLDSILLQQQSLSEQEHALIQALARIHLEKHTGDVEQSLAALSDVGSVRRDLAKLADKDIDATLSHMPSGHTARLLDAQSAKTLERPDNGERYRILRPHAKGGLGEVFVARDTELNREVALKQMQAKHADNEQGRARFLMEAELTGSLEHPGIVPVYGLGQYDDGKPFYAMRFIRGDSLKDAIERFHTAESGGRGGTERALELRKLLGRFIDVCNAVQYAHSRGVLHRDLKPGNVMLGNYGETLVVDWGLAKLTDRPESGVDVDEATIRPSHGSGSTPTMLGTAVGTPAYMSPEQAAGRLDELGPATDVYSLGATLYCLLTGQPSQTGKDTATALRNIQRGEFVRPRIVNPHVPEGLEAITMKAMALRPGDRYQSPRELADDIERWLADEPVDAFREPLGVRVARWMRKNKTWTQAAAAALILVAAVSIVAVVVVNGARREESRQRRTAQQKHVEAESARRAADSARRNAERLAAQNKQLAAKEQKLRQKAEQAKEQAGELRNRALKTYHALVFEVQNELGDKAALFPLKQRLLTKAMEGLNEMSRTTEAADQAPDVLLAAAHLQMGDTFRALVDEGGVVKARAEYEKARQILESVFQRQPQHPAARRSLATAIERLGHVHKHLGDASAARNCFEESVRHFRELNRSDKDNDQESRMLASLCYNLGQVAMELGDARKARDSFFEAHQRLIALVKADPDDASLKEELAASHNSLGNVELSLGDDKKARTHYQQSLSICEALLAAGSGGPTVRRALAMAHQYMGALQQKTSQFDGARTSFVQSLELRRKLAADHPRDTEIKRELAVAHFKLGGVLQPLGDPAEARKQRLEFLRLSEEIAKADPRDALAQRQVYLGHKSLGDLDFEEGELEQAREQFEAAHRLAEQLANAAPPNATARGDLASSFYNLARLAAASKDQAASRKHFEQSGRIYQALVQADPENAGNRLLVGFVFYQIGSLDQQQKQYEAAIDSYQQSLDVFHKLHEEGKLVPQYEFRIRSLQQAISICKMQLERSK